MKFYALLMVAMTATYITHLRHEITFWKDMGDMQYKFFLNAVEERNQKGDELRECLSANYELSGKINDVELRNTMIVMRGTELIRRLKKTTDVLESTARCAYFKLDPSACGVEKSDLFDLMTKNRNGKF